MKVLIVIDMQKDFTTGALGNPETAAVVGNVAEYITKFRNENKDGKLIATLDTHNEDYMNTQEGKKLPVPHWRMPLKMPSARTASSWKRSLSALLISRLLSAGMRISRRYSLWVSAQIYALSAML